MAIVQNHRKRKATGGRYKDVLPKRLAQKGSLPSLTKIGENRQLKRKIRGGSTKSFLASANKVNLVDPKTKKSTMAEIVNVEENKASRHFIRRNIMTKGAIIETSKGKARITNRPGQEGAINAVLVK